MSDKEEDPDDQKYIKRRIRHLNIHKILRTYGASDPLSWTSEAMITNMIVLLCLSALFPVLMGAHVSNRVKDCSDIYASGYRTSGVYTINTLDGPVQVYCVEFVHQLTRRHHYKLRVDLEDFQGKKAYALYESFSVDSEADGYKLHVSGFVDGGAGDSLSYINGVKFSTYDKDQDNSKRNCAMTYFGGGFWYNDCYYTNPTGQYLWEKEGTVMNTGVTWYYWKNNWNSLKSITMKIRRVK
ncbi:microfibril-associated glycoprotein 4-like [Onychostoma macrolepis]|uniref:microfibril-associated glycoprotein 4-like n=1 Tax=Onychostoma macrolepis TaxID=369639 RepID=UPI00272A9EE7|nr:microfibril-associated glycoprotein 4-like [Onychostoma macrolepis]